MAHELEFVNASASFIYVGESAWHRYGKAVSPNISLDDAMTESRTNYPVEVRPVYLESSDAPGTFVESDVAKVTVRADTNMELGRVSPGYTPIQNREAFGVLRPLIDEGVARIETGGVLRNGRDAFLTVNFSLDHMPDEVRTKLGEGTSEALAPYGLIRVNHDGRAAVLLQQTVIRVVCANTLADAEGESAFRVQVEHRGDAAEKLREAGEQVFGKYVDRLRRVLVEYELLKSTAVTPEQFGKLVLDEIAPHPLSNPRFNPNAATAKLVIERVEKKRDRITWLWTHGDGHTGEPSAWYAYNAVAQGVDHAAELWPTRGPSWRLQSLMMGELGRMKNRVFSNLLALAGDRRDDVL